MQVPYSHILSGHRIDLLFVRKSYEVQEFPFYVHMQLKSNFGEWKFLLTIFSISTLEGHINNKSIISLK